LRNNAQKEIGELQFHIRTEKADADARLAEVKRLERATQVKLDEAEDLRVKYQSALSEVNAQKEKLKAALV
jgi:hypothetical protein